MDQDMLTALLPVLPETLGLALLSTYAVVKVVELVAQLVAGGRRRGRHERSEEG